MKKLTLTLLTVAAMGIINTPTFANTKNTSAMGPWYAYVGTGYAWSLNAGINNPNPAAWDFANEGYDSNLGHGGFYSIGFGRNICEYLHMDLSYTNYATLHYQKYQTGEGSSIGSTGNTRTRFFDLDSQSILLNFALLPAEEQFSAHLGGVYISPFINAGIGIGFNRVGNFHTVASNGAVTTIADPNNTANFAWQGSLGLTMHPDCSHLFLDVGYRYYDGGHFESDNVFTINTGGASGAKVQAQPMRGKFTSNQVFANLRYLF